MALTLLNRFKRILIVEDDKVLRAQLVAAFKEKGYTVVEAGDAHESLAQMASSRPHAMVLDLMLPIKDGISLLDELRQAGYTLPVVILSNLLGSGDLRADAERLGATFHNKSSVSLADVVKSVEEKL